MQGGVVAAIGVGELLAAVKQKDFFHGGWSLRKLMWRQTTGRALMEKQSEAQLILAE
ncbi:hypothetical protein D9M68_924330 [compost metagenome]